MIFHVMTEDFLATVEPNKDDFNVKYDRTGSVTAKTLDMVIYDITDH